MEDKDIWKSFETTGRVADYLHYRNYANPRREVDKEAGHCKYSKDVCIERFYSGNGNGS